MPKPKSQIQIVPAKAFRLKKGSKYLLILPVDAKTSTIAPAIAKFFGDDTPVFVLAAQDVNEIKLAELMKE